MTNTEKFWRDYQRRITPRLRQPMPTGTTIDNEPQEGKGGELSVRYIHQQKNSLFGNVSYFIGSASDAELRFYIERAIPSLANPTFQDSTALPRALVITSFHSYYEKDLKGVGSAMLRELLQIADMAECTCMIVLSGINHEVYSAFDFDLVDPLLETWYITISKLRARLSPLRSIRESP